MAAARLSPRSRHRLSGNVRGLPPAGSRAYHRAAVARLVRAGDHERHCQSARDSRTHSVRPRAAVHSVSARHGHLEVIRMSRFVPVALACFALCVLRAQPTPISELNRDYKSVRDFVIRAAEKMPEASYSFKPSPDVRTFGEQIAHIADDQYNLCSPAKGETRKAAYTAIESSLSKKADLVPALKEAFAYCDAAYGSMTDASAREVAASSKMPRTKFSWLNWNLWHTWEHYGNIVVYLRMKGLVPPSSEPR